MAAIKTARPASILDAVPSLPSSSSSETELSESESSSSLPPLDQVLESVNRVERDLRDEQLRVQEHHRLDSNDDDDEEKRALKNYIRLLEPAYYGQNTLLRTLISQVAQKTKEVHSKMDTLEVKIDRMAGNGGGGESDKVLTDKEWHDDDNQSSKSDDDSNIWFAPIITVICNFVDSQIASIAAHHFGIRRHVLAKLSII